MDLGLPLSGGYLPKIPSNASREMQITAINDVIERLNSQLQTQTISDDTTRRMIFGYQENGWGEGKHFGIKISIDGVDVALATDDQLLFKMDMSTWFWYDPTTHKNVAQVGTLPDGVGGIAGAKPGFNVEDSYA